MLSKILQTLGVVVVCLLAMSSCTSSMASAYSAAHSKVMGLGVILVLVWLFISWLDSDK